jgi:PAS domain S-box-containing protein
VTKNTFRSPVLATGSILRRRRPFLVLMLTLFVIVISLSTYLTVENVGKLRSAHQHVQHSLRTLIQTREIYSALADAQISERGYLLTKDASYLVPYQTATRSIPPRFRGVEARLAGEPEQLALLAELRRLSDERLSELTKSLSLSQSGDDASALQLMSSDAAKHGMEQIGQLVDRIDSGEYNVLAVGMGDARLDYNNAILGGVLSGIFALALLLLLALVESRERNREYAAEIDLFAERERFRATLQSIGDGVIVADERGNVEYVNPVGQALTGFGDDAHGLPIAEVFRIVSEEEHASREQPVTQVLHTGVRATLPRNTLLIHKDGSERPIEDNATPIHDASGHITGAVLVFRDGSEKRRYTLALQRSEAEFRALFEEAGIGKADLTIQAGIFSRVNRRLVELTGFTVEELRTKRLSDLFLAEEKEAIDQMIVNLRDEKLIAGVHEGPLARKDGKTVWTRVSTNLISGAEYVDPVILAMFEDISETRHAIEALRDSENRMRIILENVITFVMLLSPDGTILQVNGAAREMGGIASADLLGVRIDESFTFNYDEAIAASVRDAINQAAAGKQVRTDLRARLSQSRYITLDAWLAPVYDGEDTPAYLVASGVDITERKMMEDQLQAADRRKDEFLAMLGHELRNPLAPIATAVALLRATEGRDERILSHSVGVIERQSEHLTSLVNDLLDVARFTSGKISLHLEVLDVAMPVRRAIELNEAMFKAHRQDFQVNLPDHPIYVRGDLHRLTQVFGNLLNNASKYSETDARIEISAVEEEGQVLVAVSDTGMGISSDVLPHVFDLFTQSQRALDRAQGGLGIGLTLVKRLIDLHHGEVAAASAGAGKGSRFTVSLPRVEPAAKPEAEHAPGEFGGETLSVLVVDDNRDAAEMLAELIKILGHRAVAAFDGQSAMSLAIQLSPDVIMLDIGLPGLSGLEVAEKLRNLPETRSAYLVAVTGYGQQQDRELSAQAGFDAHLVKPLDQSDIASILGGQLRRRRADRDARR